MAPTGRKWLQNLLFWSNQKTSYTPPPLPPHQQTTPNSEHVNQDNHC